MAPIPDLVLYYAPLTRAGRVRWLLEELEVPYRLHRLDFAGGEHRRDAYRAIHPMGKVPALAIDGEILLESGAMMVYLADRFADRGLAPALDAPDRARYLQWIFFGTTTLEPPLGEAFTLGVQKGDAAAVAAGRDKFSAGARVLEAALADGRPYVLGDRFTAADIGVGQALGWARALGALDPHPGLIEYGRRIAGRPAAKRARAD